MSGMGTAPRIVIGPDAEPAFSKAVQDGGGVVVAPGESADGMVWYGFPTREAAISALHESDPGWVQLAASGVDDYINEEWFTDERVWTSAKGSFAGTVAEHALTLTLAGLRYLHVRIPATEWAGPQAETLFGKKVLIVGAGGIALELMRLMAPFRPEVTLVRRRPEPVEGARATITFDQLDAHLGEADIVVLAAPLTADTTGLIGARQFELMKPTAWLVNVARGQVVVTDELVDALRSGQIAGAATDVTDPEPLPAGHPLWSIPNCIITPHTAGTWPLNIPRLAERIRENVQLLAKGGPLIGMVDRGAGY